MGMVNDALNRLGDYVRVSLFKHMAVCGEGESDIIQMCATSYDTFTAWTKRRVYFPATYEGDVWVTSVPRDPCECAMQPVGG